MSNHSTLKIDPSILLRRNPVSTPLVSVPSVNPELAIQHFEECIQGDYELLNRERERETDAIVRNIMMGVPCPRVPNDVSGRTKTILQSFSNEPSQLAGALAKKRFGQCEGCGRWTYLVIHHFGNVGSYKVHTREVCVACNNRLPTTNGHHILPSWREQLAILRNYKPYGSRNPKLVGDDVADDSPTEYALKREALERDEVEKERKERVSGINKIKRCMKKLQRRLKGTPSAKLLGIVEDYLEEEVDDYSYSELLVSWWSEEEKK